MTSLRRISVSPGEESADMTSGSLFFIGTATVLLRYAGFTVLTDPNFLHQGQHVHLGYGVRSQRLTNPALKLDELPPIDLVVLSHLHEDHFDRVVARSMRKSIPIVTTPQAAKVLRKKGFRSLYPLGTWDTFLFEKGKRRLRITSLPAKHGPGVVARLLPPVMGSMLEFEQETNQVRWRLYISGDTLYYEHLKEIPRRYPAIDLALLHLGGTRIFGILLTMDGKQGVETLKLMGPSQALPLHFNDYTVFKSPLEDFQRAVRDAGLQERVRYLQHGETYTFNVFGRG